MPISFLKKLIFTCCICCFSVSLLMEFRHHRIYLCLLLFFLNPNGSYKKVLQIPSGRELTSNSPSQSHKSPLNILYVSCQLGDVRIGVFRVSLPYLKAFHGSPIAINIKSKLLTWHTRPLKGWSASPASPHTATLRYLQLPVGTCVSVLLLPLSGRPPPLLLQVNSYSFLETQCIDHKGS